MNPTQRKYLHRRIDEIYTRKKKELDDKHHLSLTNEAKVDLIFKKKVKIKAREDVKVPRFGSIQIEDLYDFASFQPTKAQKDKYTKEKEELDEYFRVVRDQAMLGDDVEALKALNNLEAY